MLTTLQRSGGIEALARQAGVEPAQALAETKRILPGLLAAYRDYSGGNSALLAMFGQHGGAGLAAEVMGVDRADTSAGEAIIAAALDETSAEEQWQTRLSLLLAMLVSGYLSATAARLGSKLQGIDDLLGQPT